MDTHKNPAGGEVLACGFDQYCVDVDCETCLEEIPTTLNVHSDAPDYLAHYCGLGCAELWQRRKEEE